MNYRIFLLCLIFFACNAPKDKPATTPGGETPENSFGEPNGLSLLESNKELQTIAFGSCNRQDANQPMWEVISTNEPDLWIWLGDNIYGDTGNMGLMKSKYEQQFTKPQYQDFLKQTPLVGIWDDHDYGVNDGDKNFGPKRESKALMLDFLGVPDDAPVRSYEGAYQSYVLGPAGKQVKILLLDCRYFRDELEKDPTQNNRYVPNPDGDILGEAQWVWLEDELRNSEAAVHLIASGVQILPEEHRFEKWANFPTSRQRLFDLLAEIKPANPILLSGDRHLAEVSRLELEGLPKPLYEITSSGLTHSYEAADEDNQYRVGPLIGSKNFGLLYIGWTNGAAEINVEIRGSGNEVLVQQDLN